MKARPASTGTTNTHLQDLEAQVRMVVAESNVPGLALLILKDGEVVLSRGFGKRNVAAGLPVTPRTLFPIGSSSKAFTAAAIAMLVEEGKLEWDKPVRHYLPSFKLHDPFASERMTPRDLLCHRSGLPRHEIMWYNALFTRKEMVERLQYLEPNVDFRVMYQYQNLMYATAGYLIECVTGQTWEEFVAERIFKPLGMNRTNTSVHDSQQTDDYALPYAEEEHEVKEIPFYDRVQATGPAGSINTTLEDIKHWLLFQLNNGKHRETQLLAAEQLAQNHTPQMLIPASPILNFQESSTSSYGMGWEVGSFRGHRMLQHGGSINGFSAQVVLLPDNQAAVAVFTNLGGTLAPYAAAFYACDYLLGAEAPDWNGRWKEELAKLKALREQQAAELAQVERVPDAPPSHPLEAYIGKYEHSGYGAASVTLNDGQLHLTYNDVTAPLTHFHYDLFEMFIKLAQYKAKVSFTTGETGAIESLSANLEPAVKAIVFTRVASKEEQEESAERKNR